MLQESKGEAVRTGSFLSSMKLVAILLSMMFSALLLDSVLSEVKAQTPPQIDIEASVQTAGRVLVGGTTTGEIHATSDPNARDHDWFAVDLELGKGYRVEVRGYSTRDGSLKNPLLVGMYDSKGVYVPSSQDDNTGEGFNSLEYFAPALTGTYFVGVSGVQASSGTYTVAVSLEPPDDFVDTIRTTGTVTVGGSTNGEITLLPHRKTDHDWLAVSLEAGKIYQIDVKGSPTGDGTLKDPLLASVIDANGRHIPHSSDDNDGKGLNAVSIFSPPMTGTYFIVARAHGFNLGTYTVSVAEAQADDFAANTSTTGSVSVGGTATGEINRVSTGKDHDWFRVTLEAGKNYRIDIKGKSTNDGTLADPVLTGIHDSAGKLIPGTNDGDSGTGRNSLMYFAPGGTANFYISVRGMWKDTLGTYTVAVSEVVISNDDYVASPSTTGTITVDSFTSGTINTVGDIDWLAVTLTGGQIYRISVKGAHTGDGTLPDPLLIGVYDASANYIANTRDDDGGQGSNSLKKFTPATSSTYYVALRGYRNHTGTYRVGVLTTNTDDFAASKVTTGKVSVGGTATGEISTIAKGNDHDWFAVSLVKGKTYTFEVRGKSTNDGTLEDPILVGLYTQSGSYIRDTGDDNSGTGYNSLKAYRPTYTGTFFMSARAHNVKTGTYTVAVAEVVSDDFAADTSTTGSLAVGGTATGEITPKVSGLDIDWFAISMEAGKTYQIDAKGKDTSDGTLPDPQIVGLFDSSGTKIKDTTRNDTGHGRNARLVYAALTTATHYIAIRSKDRSTGSYTLALMVVESDDYLATTLTTGTVAVGGSATGKIERFGDVDWFSVPLTVGLTYSISIEGYSTGAGTLLDPVLDGIYGSDGTKTAKSYNDDGGVGLNALLLYTPPSSGTFFIAVRNINSKKATGTYKVSVELRTDDYAATVTTTGRVAVGGTVAGEIHAFPHGARDHDWFAVDLTRGKTYQIEVQGAATGDGTLLDPILVGVHSSDGRYIKNTGDDNSGKGLNSLAVFKPESSATYYIGVRAHNTKTGTYKVEVTEAMSDDFAHDTTTTGTVTVGGTATGTIDPVPAQSPHDRDWFAVTLQAGTTYRIEVLGAATGDGTLADPILIGIFDSSGTSIKDTGDDNSGTGKNSRAYFAPVTAGKYFVAVRAHSKSIGGYTVAVNSEPADDYLASVSTTGTVSVDGSATGVINPTPKGESDHDWFAISLVASKIYLIEVLGAANNDGTLTNPVLIGVHDSSGDHITGSGDQSSGDGTNSRKYFSPTSSGTHYIGVRSGDANFGGTYKLVVTSQPDDDFAASTSTTGTVSVDGTTTGTIGKIANGNDHDWLSTNLTAGVTYAIEVRGSHTGEGTLGDPILHAIHDSSGTMLNGTADDNGGSGKNSLRVFSPMSTGTYYIVARAHGTVLGTYTVAVSTIVDDYAATIATTGVVAENGSVTGEIHQFPFTNADADWFSMSGVAGKTYRIDVKGLPTKDGTLADPILIGLYSSTGTTLPNTRDDDGGESSNAMKYFAPKITDTYFIGVRGVGQSSGTYTVALSVVGVDGDDYTATTSTTGTIVVDATATGEINVGGDIDWFSTALTVGNSYTVEIRGSSTGDGTLQNPILAGIYDSSGAFIANTGNDNGGFGNNSLKVFVPTSSGTYYVSARAHNGNTGTYTAEVSEIDDDYTASVATTGRVTVGGSISGEINDYPVGTDGDWIAVSLDAGKGYWIDVKGAQHGDGTLAHPRIADVLNSAGTESVLPKNYIYIVGQNVRAFLVPPKSDTYYIWIIPLNSEKGTYVVEVTEEIDDFAATVSTTGSVTVGGSTTGVIGRIPNALDHDWFAVSLLGGKSYSVEVKGAETSDGSLADPVLDGVFDASGTKVSGSTDDNSGQGLNSHKIFSATTSGTFYVAVRAKQLALGSYTVAVSVLTDDFSASIATTGTVAVDGTANGEINTFPIGVDHDWFSTSLVAGSLYLIEVKGKSSSSGTLDDPYLIGVFDSTGSFIKLTFNDDSGTGNDSRKIFEASSTGTHYIGVRGYRFTTGTYVVAVKSLPSDDFAESVSTTGTVTVGGSATGKITLVPSGTDKDWFSIVLVGGKTYRIDVKGAPTKDGTLANPILVGVHDSNGAFISSTGDDNGGHSYNSQKIFKPDADATYYIAVRGHGSKTGTYTVEVTLEPDDDFENSVSTTGSVTVSGTATGAITRTARINDHDWFSVSLTGSTSYWIEVRGKDTGDGTLVDPLLVGMSNSSGGNISNSGDDNSGTGKNSLSIFTPDSTGTYYIIVRAHGTAVGTYTVAVTEIVADDFAGSVSTTGSVAVGDSITGAITRTANLGSNDHDWIAVTFENGNSYSIHVRGSETSDGTLEDPLLIGIRDTNGVHIDDTGDDNSGQGKNAYKSFAATYTGTHYIAVRAHGINVGTYTVAVSNTVDDYANTATLASLEMNQVKVVEGGVVSFNVRLSEATTTNVTVDWTVSGTVTAGDDFVGTTDATTLTIPAGDLVASISINTIDDDIDESDETLTVTLSNPVGATLGSTTSADVTISDNDEALTVSFDPAGTQTVTEDAGTITVALQIANSLTGPVSVNYRVSGTATKGTDFSITGLTGTDGVVSIASGSSTANISVTIVDDSVDDSGETVVLTLLQGTGYSLGTTQRITLTINNHDPLKESDLPPPVLSITGGDAVTEGEKATFTVSADKAPTVALTVLLTVEEASGADFVESQKEGSAVVTLGASQTEAVFELATVDDHIDETDADITVTLATGRGYTIAANPNNVATVTVADNDLPPPVVSIVGGDPVTEGTNAVFTVRTDRAPTILMAVNLSVVEAADSDFVGDAYKGAVSVSIPVGETEVAFEVTTENDDVDEVDGSVTVTVQERAGYVIATAPGNAATVVIEDDDLPPPVMSVAAKTATVVEGNNAVFTVSADRALDANLTVGIEIAEAGTGEFVAAKNEGSFSVVISSGSASVDFAVSTINDKVFEPNGSVGLTLVAGPGYTLGDPKKATVTITSEDPKPVGPTVSVNDVSGHESKRDMIFTISLSQPVMDKTVIVAYHTQETTPVSAQAWTDYIPRRRSSVEFAPGETSKRIWVLLIDDKIDDPGERLELKLYRSWGAKLAKRIGVGTIINSDPMPKAWLARFGRTVSEQTLDGVATRLDAPRVAGFEGSFGGLDFSFGGLDNESATELPISNTNTYHQSGSDGFQSLEGSHQIGVSPMDPTSSMSFEGALDSATFTLTSREDRHGGSLSMWGTQSQTYYDGMEDTLQVNGEVNTGMIGVDYAISKWTLGVAMTQSSAEGAFTDASATESDVMDGDIESSLTATISYAATRISDRVQLWTTVGKGSGKMNLMPNVDLPIDNQKDSIAIKTDIDWTMAAAGVRGDVLTPFASRGLTLSVVSDALWTQTGSSQVSGLAASDAGVNRLRLGLEGTYPIALQGRSSLTPTLTLGARHDDGDAETGFGLELGGGIAWSVPKIGLSVDIQGRSLIAHESDSFSEYGYSTSIGFDPIPASDRGLALTLQQQVGSPTTGGIDALFASHTSNEYQGFGFTSERQAVTASFGTSTFKSRYVSTPYIQYGVSETNRDYNLGWRLVPSPSAPNLSIGARATLLENNNSASSTRFGIEFSLGL